MNRVLRILDLPTEVLAIVAAQTSSRDKAHLKLSHRAFCDSSRQLPDVWHVELTCSWSLSQPRVICLAAFLARYKPQLEDADNVAHLIYTHLGAPGLEHFLLPCLTGRLEELVLGFGDDEGDPLVIVPPLGGLTALTRLQLSMATGVPAALPPNLAELKICDARTGLSDAAARQATALTRLELFCSLGDSGPLPAAVGLLPALKELWTDADSGYELARQLTWLDISADTGIEGLSSLTALTRLRGLTFGCLSDQGVELEGLPDISMLTRLKVINLCGCSIAQFDVAMLPYQLTRLELPNLNTVPLGLGALTALRELNLDHPYDGSPEGLLGVSRALPPNLTRLSLPRLSRAAVPAPVLQLHQLRELRFTGPIGRLPAELQRPGLELWFD